MKVSMGEKTSSRVGWVLSLLLIAASLGAVTARADKPPRGTKIVFSKPVNEEGRPTNRYFVSAVEYDEGRDDRTRLVRRYDFLYDRVMKPFFISDPFRDENGRLPWLVVGVTYPADIEGAKEFEVRDRERARDREREREFREDERDERERERARNRERWRERAGHISVLGERGWRHIPLIEFGPDSDRLRVEKLEFFRWNSRQILVVRTARRWDEIENSKHLFLWDIGEVRWEGEHRVVTQPFPYSKLLKEKDLHDLEWLQRIEENKFAVLAKGQLGLVETGEREDADGRFREARLIARWNLLRYKKHPGQEGDRERMKRFESALANREGVWIQAEMHSGIQAENKNELIWIPFKEPETDGVALPIKITQTSLLGIAEHGNRLLYAQEKAPYHFMSAESEDEGPEEEDPSFFHFDKLLPLASEIGFRATEETRLKVYSRYLLER